MTATKQVYINFKEGNVSFNYSLTEIKDKEKKEEVKGKEKLEKVSNENNITIDGTTILLIDNSGSRFQEMKLYETNRNQITREYIDHYIRESRRERPNEKIFVITFDSDIQVYGDFSNTYINDSEFGNRKSYNSEKIINLADTIVKNGIQTIRDAFNNVTNNTTANHSNTNIERILSEQKIHSPSGGLSSLGKALFLGFSIVSRTGGKIMLFTDGLDTNGFNPSVPGDSEINQLTTINKSRKQIMDVNNIESRLKEGNTFEIDFEIYAFEDCLHNFPLIIDFAKKQFNSDVKLMMYKKMEKEEKKEEQKEMKEEQKEELTEAQKKAKEMEEGKLLLNGKEKEVTKTKYVNSNLSQNENKSKIILKKSSTKEEDKGEEITIDGFDITQSNTYTINNINLTNPDPSDYMTIIIEYTNDDGEEMQYTIQSEQYFAYMKENEITKCWIKTLQEVRKYLDTDATRAKAELTKFYNDFGGDKETTNIELTEMKKISKHLETLDDTNNLKNAINSMLPESLDEKLPKLKKQNEQ